MNDPQAEWILTDETGFAELGGSDRIREKIAKLSSLNHQIFTSKQESDNACKEAERREQVANASRQEAEMTRQQAERSRQEAEASRQEAERDREESEKLLEEAENQRQAAENQRQVAEVQRQAAEVQRQAAEKHREQAENQRQATEKRVQRAEKRILDAEKRVFEAETRSQQAEKRSQDAEQSRQLAEIRRQQAESMKQEAVQRRLEAERCLLEAEKNVADAVKSKENEARQRQEAERNAADIKSQLHQVEEQLQVSEQQMHQAQEDAQRRIREAEEAQTRARNTEEARNDTIRQLQQMERRAQDAEAQLMQEQAHRAREASQNVGGEKSQQWLVKRREIHMTNEKLGKGGWAKVKVAEFRGMRVAAKKLFKELQSPFYHNAFIREMNMASRCRHPNLVQFLGASMDEEMVILMELMPTSLRQHLTSNAPAVPSAAFRISVSLDVAKALNYLHLMQPDPIIHRDISCANVLLEPLSNQVWRAKVTDYGSVNLQSQVSTKNPGNPVYSAPESNDKSLQSPKMDIFSFGILLVTMCTAEFPLVERRESMIATIRERRCVTLIRHCICRDRNQRPSAAQLVSELKTWS